MEDSKMALKIDKETKNVCDLAERLEDIVKHQFDKGIEFINVEEMGKVIDMIKDLYEAKEKIVKACYYKQVVEAMEEEDFDDEEDIMDYGRRGYRGQRRDSRGRYMSSRSRGGRRGYEEPMYFMTPEMYREHRENPEWYRDMDRENEGKMYYTSSNMGGGNTSSRGGSMNGGSMGNSSSNRSNYGGESGRSESRSERARRNYTESKEIHKNNTAEDKSAKMRDLEEFMKELSADIVDMVKDMSPEEKNLAKSKISTLATKM